MLAEPVRDDALGGFGGGVANDGEFHVVSGRELGRGHPRELREVEEEVRGPVARPDEAEAAAAGLLRLLQLLYLRSAASAVSCAN